MDAISEERTPLVGEGKFLSVNAIHKELEDTSNKTEAIVQKIKALTDEVTKLKETLLLMTGAKLAFQKIVNASEQTDASETNAS